MKHICFVPKRIKGDRRPWIRFGASRHEYERWSPEICGVCCLKMVGDTFHKTNHISLYTLTMLCLQKGGFAITADGCIEGVFHHPLLSLAKSFGLNGWAGKLTQKSVIKALQEQKFVILSVDLNKINPILHEGHLILIHRYDPFQRLFIVHDPSNIVRKNGKNAKLDEDYLAFISNNKGVLLWPVTGQLQSRKQTVFS